MRKPETKISGFLLYTIVKHIRTVIINFIHETGGTKMENKNKRKCSIAKEDVAIKTSTQNLSIDW